MGVLGSYKMRLRRRRYRLRALRKGRELSLVVDRTQQLKRNDILLFCTLRDERPRLSYFLKYYREMGIDHFFFVDNGSTDGSREYLAEQRDVSVWTTDASYKRARFGVDWLNWLQSRYGAEHWNLVVDADEFLVYPFCDTRPLRALTDWLDASSIRSFGTILLDMYPQGPINAVVYRDGQNPLEIANWFDTGNYTISRNNLFWNLWIQGGPRLRSFFSDSPERAPALNKIPLVKWQRHYAYVSSTHMLLPRGLNLVYDDRGGEKTSGALLHAKFLHTIFEKSSEELKRKQHFADSQEYKAYNEGIAANPDMWCKWSEQYINWRQLEILGLMSKGNWA